MKTSHLALLVLSSSLLSACGGSSSSDSTAPVISALTSSSDWILDTDELQLSFETSEAGTLSFAGACSDFEPIELVQGNQALELDSLNAGSYDDCSITVTDSSGNVSEAISITSFDVVSTTDLAQVTFVDADNTDPAPDGSYSNPYATLAEGIANVGITGEIYVFDATATYEGNFTLADGMTLAGSGADYETQASIEIPVGEYPVLDGISAGPVLTLEGNNLVIGVQVQSSGTASGVTSEIFPVNGNSYDTTRAGIVANAAALGSITISNNLFESLKHGVVMGVSDTDIVIDNNTMDIGSETEDEGNAVVLTMYGNASNTVDIEDNQIVLTNATSSDLLEMDLVESAQVTLTSRDNELSVATVNGTGDLFDFTMGDSVGSTARLSMTMTNDELNTSGRSGPDALDITTYNDSRLDIVLDNVSIEQTVTFSGGPDTFDMATYDNSTANITVNNGSSFISEGVNPANDIFDLSASDTSTFNVTVEDSTLMANRQPEIDGSSGGNVFDLDYEDSSVATFVVRNSVLNSGPESIDSSSVDLGLVTLQNDADLTFTMDESELVALDEGVFVETEDASVIALNFIDSELTAPDYGFAFTGADTSSATLDLSGNTINSSGGDAISITGSDAGQCAGISSNTLSSAAGFDDILLSGTLSIEEIANLSVNNNSANVNQGAAVITNVINCP